jgi:hypothetical protein
VTEPTKPPRNDWRSPPVVLAVLGMIGTAVGSYGAFNSRITALEVRGERLAIIEAKIDRLIYTERVR